MKPQARTVLKASAKRTVSLERSPTGGTHRVVKRFHAPASNRSSDFIARLVAGLGDRRRALGEARALRAAHRAGLPVPEVLGCTRQEEHWELTTSAVPGARPLADVLTESFSGVRRSDKINRLAQDLADLALRALDAGFVHADPHPSNILVDDSGGLWIIDVARSRTGAGRARVEASLIRALSRLRELTPSTFRWRMARAYFDGPPDAAFVRQSEAHAIRQRIEELEARVAVWRRTSSATEVRVSTNGTRAVHVRARSGPAIPGWRIERIQGPGAMIDAIWSTLVRAKLHGVPAVEPRALALSGPERWLEAEVPAPEPGLGSSPASIEIDRLRTRLRLRGLAIENTSADAAVVRSPEGSALVGPGATLVPWGEGASAP